MKVKICGLLEPADAAVASEAGADMVGVIFAPAWRSRSLAQARAILDAAGPNVERVGVFVDAPLADVREAIRDCALDRVQLGGRETPAYCVALDGRAVKTLRLPGDQDLFGSYAVPLFHLDTPHARLAGGTGQSWSYALARGITAKYPVLLAGGLRPDNVAQAIVAARPFGVDVCSGVETDRRKDPDKIEAFIRNVRAAVETLCATG